MKVLKKRRRLLYEYFDKIQNQMNIFVARTNSP